MRVTRIGGPTVLVELEGWRIIVDPTFDPPGRRYSFGFGTSSVKTLGPAVSVADLGRVDLALVSHDHHADNLDDAGRVLLGAVDHVVTTAPGARRLSHASVHGLKAGQTTRLTAPGKPALEITATPARHGPPLSRPIVGAVVGFAVRVEGAHRIALWVSGDTVMTRQLRQFALTASVDVAVVNAGGVLFGITGPLRYTMTGADVVSLIDALDPRVAIPAHYDGWTHFRDGEAGVSAAARSASAAVRGAIRFLPDGVPTTVA